MLYLFVRGPVLPADKQMHHLYKDFGHFASLKSVELQIQLVSSKPCELNAKFLCEFV